MNNMILTVGVIILFGTFLIGANTLMLNNSRIAEDGEYTIAAVSIAQSVIDEAKTKAFDQKTVAKSVSARDSLTAVAKIGADAGETVPAYDTLGTNGYSSTSVFNDIDDYNKYYRTVNTSRNGGYIVDVAVNYANEATPTTTSGTRTYCKMMTVRVTHPLLSRAVTLSYAFTY